MSVCYLTTISLSWPYSVHDSMIYEYGAVCGMRVGKETEALGENLPHATLSTKIPTWSDLGSKPNRRGGKPANNRLGYGTAHQRWRKKRRLCRPIGVSYFHLLLIGWFGQREWDGSWTCLANNEHWKCSQILFGKPHRKEPLRRLCCWRRWWCWWWREVHLVSWVLRSMTKGFCHDNNSCSNHKIARYILLNSWTATHCSDRSPYHLILSLSRIGIQSYTGVHIKLPPLLLYIYNRSF
jgi:hypothetical protein